MQFSIQKAYVNVTHDSENSEKLELCFELEVDGVDFIEVSDSYVISRSIDGHEPKQAVRISLTLKDKEALEETVTAATKKYMSTQEWAIGYSGFAVAKNYPATMINEVFLDLNILQDLKRHLLNGRLPSEISFSFGDSSKLTYGWEPDGSHQIWQVKPDEGFDDTYLPIVKISFYYKIK